MPDAHPGSAPDLEAAKLAVEVAATAVDRGSAQLAARSVDGERISVARLDEHQVLAYDVAHAAGAVAGCRVMLDYAEHGDYEALLSTAFIADAVWDLSVRIASRESEWGVEPGALSAAHDFVSAHRSPAFLAALGAELPTRGTGPAHLPDEFELVRETFHRFAEDKIRPVAEHVHRDNLDIPESVISGLAEIGGFGLSVPEEYEGYTLGGEQDYIGMVVATEELSWGSLGVGGSLITRPEILTRAIVRGGTEAQKQRWLPKIRVG